MKINTVIVTYNRLGLLKECIEALLAQTYEINKIIIVDNASTDDTTDYLKKNYSDDPRFEICVLPDNYGGAGGFYYGIKKAYDMGCDWVWAMDDDSIPKKDALSELVKAIDLVDDDKISFLASAVFGPEGEAMNVPLVSSARDDNGYQNWYKNLKKSIVRIDCATLVSLLFSTKAIKKVGAPHPFFFIWGDDTEYTRRLTKYYGAAYFVGTSEVVHKRFGAKNLSIFDETNPNRVNMYKYFYRNNLVINRFYESKKSVIKFKIKLFKDCLKLLKSNDKLKFKKISVIRKAKWEYNTGKYNKKAFMNRFKNVENDILLKG